MSYFPLFVIEQHQIFMCWFSLEIFLLFYLISENSFSQIGLLDKYYNIYDPQRLLLWKSRSDVWIRGATSLKHLIVVVLV